MKYFLFFFLLIPSLCLSADKWILDDGRVVDRNTIVEVNGEIYGLGDYDNPEKLAEMKAKPLIEKGLPESGYYEVDTFLDSESGGVVTRTYTTKEDRDISTLREQFKGRVLNEIVMRLQPTDHHVKRQLDDVSYKIPVDVTAERLKLWDAYDVLTADIDSLTYQEIVSRDWTSEINKQLIEVEK